MTARSSTYSVLHPIAVCSIYTVLVIEAIVVHHMQHNQMNAMMVMSTKPTQTGNKSYPISAQKLLTSAGHSPSE